MHGHCHEFVVPYMLTVKVLHNVVYVILFRMFYCMANLHSWSALCALLGFHVLIGAFLHVWLFHYPPRKLYHFPFLAMFCCQGLISSSSHWQGSGRLVPSNLGRCGSRRCRVWGLGFRCGVMAALHPSSWLSGSFLSCIVQLPASG